MDKSRPVSSNPVAGTPWCVVWTGDHKVNLVMCLIRKWSLANNPVKSD